LAPSTITRISDLRRELVRIRKLGWAQASGEMLMGINAIAAPVFSERGECVASIAVVGSVQFLPRSGNDRIVLAVLKAAEQTSGNLGYRRAAV
jgi:DNA-binding IclR family transcriptional regulator